MKKKTAKPAWQKEDRQTRLATTACTRGIDRCPLADRPAAENTDDVAADCPRSDQ